MRLEMFFGKFEQLAEAPNAVAKMRELVLDLAVQGKLVERSSSEGDGHSLLRQLRMLPPERNSKSRGANDICVEPETGLHIPNHWALTTVENTTRETGFFCDGDWVESKDQNADGDVRLIQLADVGDGQYRDRSSRFMTQEAATRLNCSFLKAGDLLVARMPDPLGRCCRFPGDAKPAVTVVDVCILRPNISYFDPDFLVVAINCPTFRRLVANRATGTTRSRISRSKLSVLPIPLPPLAEQKRIVTKVDELMALCARLEAQQQERQARHAPLARASLARFADAPTPANLPFLFHPSYSLTPAELRTAILRQVFLGQMRWEPCSLKPDRSHLSRLQVEHREAWKSAQLAAFKEKRAFPNNEAWMKGYASPELPDSVDLPNIPAHWVWVPLELACPTVIDSPHRTPVYSELGEYPALRPRDVANGVLKLKQAARVETSEYERQTERRKPRCGDIVYSRELSFGWAVILPEKPRICLSQGMVSMQAASEVDTRFLCQLLNSPIVRDQAESAAIGAAHPHVNLKDIRLFALPFPPLAEQRQIVGKVEQLMALVDQLEAQLGSAQSASARLLEALIAELTDEHDVQ